MLLSGYIPVSYHRKKFNFVHQKMDNEALNNIFAKVNCKSKLDNYSCN